MTIYECAKCGAKWKQAHDIDCPNCGGQNLEKREEDDEK